MVTARCRDAVRCRSPARAVLVACNNKKLARSNKLEPVAATTLTSLVRDDPPLVSGPGKPARIFPHAHSPGRAAPAASHAFGAARSSAVSRKDSRLRPSTANSLVFVKQDTQGFRLPPY